MRSQRRNRRWQRIAGGIAAAAVLVAGAGAAQALSFGTLSTGLIVPPGGGAPVQALEAYADVPPALSSADLTSGASAAGALSIFGSAHAYVVTEPGADGYAASLWTETFTFTPTSGATGAATAYFDFLLSGTLDPGAAEGGRARVSLRAIAGLSGEDSIFEEGFSALGLSYVEQVVCDGGCDDPISLDRVPFRVAVEFEWNVPFRFDALLELAAANGGRAQFSPSAWLDGIALPEEAAVHGASGWSYDDLAHVAAPDMPVVPEPGTALLVAIGVGALAARRRTS